MRYGATNAPQRILRSTMTIQNDVKITGDLIAAHDLAVADIGALIARMEGAAA